MHAIIFLISYHNMQHLDNNNKVTLYSSHFITTFYRKQWKLASRKRYCILIRSQTIREAISHNLFFPVSKKV